MKTVLDLSNIHPAKVWKFLYPLYAKKFLFGNSYEELADSIQESFTLTPEQWQAVLNEWEEKEIILNA